jgi:hypothetical protein
LEEGSGDSSPKSAGVLFPEYLTCEDKSAEIAGHIVEWLTDPASRAARVEALAALRARVAHGGASARAAEYILAALAKRRTSAPRPHFLQKAGHRLSPAGSERQRTGDRPMPYA